MDFTPWKLPRGSYNMVVNAWNLHDGSSLMERMPCVVPSGLTP